MEREDGEGGERGRAGERKSRREDGEGGRVRRDGR